MLRKISNYLLWIFLFLLPWQTRWIWHYGKLNGGAWEYGTYSLYGTEILWALLVVFFIIANFGKYEFWHRIFSKEHYRTHKKNLWIGLGFILFLIISVWQSVNWQVSYNFVLYVIEGLCLFMILAGQGEGFYKKSMYALWLGGIPQGLLALHQFFIQHVFASKWLGMAEQFGRQAGASVIEFGEERWLRAYGSFGSPNSLGIYLAILLLVGLILYLRETDAKLKIFLSVGQLFVLSGLILSFSRGAWLAAVVGLITLKIIIYIKERSKLFDFSKQAIFYILLSICFLAILYPVFAARFNLSNRLEQKSIYERQVQYGEAVSLLKPAKLLFGVGPGAFTYALYQKNINWPSYQYQPVHNIYLLILVEWGLVGIIIFLIFHLKWLEKISKNNLFFLPVIIALLCAGLFDHWLWSMWTGVVFWFVVWGMGAGKLDSTVGS
ncbi:MAG: O-antigen ligase family protein [Patescibacteria group bacterium]